MYFVDLIDYRKIFVINNEKLADGRVIYLIKYASPVARAPGVRDATKSSILSQIIAPYRTASS